MALRRFLPDPFVMLMLVSMVLGFLLPEIGANDGPLRLGEVTKLGISLVFFLHGANLARQSLIAGVKNLRVHALIQATTFIVFPIFGLVLYFGLQGVMDESLRLGFFFLAALPSTISSSVAMTALARGNVPVAVFNASLSGLLGLVLTPAMISLVTVTGEAQFSLTDAVINIAMILLLPFFVGQLMRPLIKSWLTKNKAIVSMMDRGVILLIVFTSFASSTASGIWGRFAVTEFAILLVLVFALLAVALGFTVFASRQVGLDAEDEIATVFCGSTKSLATGAPIAQVLFVGSPFLGVILLPLLLYHQFQLVICAILAQRYAKRDTAIEA